MEDLKNKLITACNESGLPLEALYFVVKDTYRDLEEMLVQMKANRANQPIPQEEKEVVEGEVENDN